MRKFVGLAFLILAFAASACTSNEPTPTFTPAPRATWTPTAKPASGTTSAPAAVSTTLPTPSATTVLPTSTPTATAVPPSSTPTVAPTIPPGLYVNSLRIDPNPPTRGSDLLFYATFVNATGTVQNYRWIVYIYRPEIPNRSFSETTAGMSAISVGTNEYKSNGSWKIALGGPCENFYARVAWLDQNNQPVNFTTPDGKIFQKDFTVCAPNDLPPAPPQPSPTPTATPTFAPGLFVLDVLTEPNPPTRGSELNFIVTFVNTTGSPQTMKWNVYIYKPGERNSYGETTAATTSMAVGINDYRSTGYWKLPLGGPCENFVVRVGWFDTDRVRMFTVFENQVFEKPITVCPP